MKSIIVLITLIGVLFGGLFIASPSVDAASRVRGYTKKNGSYVMPHYRSNKNYTKFDNWSTKGNINPYTGKKGTKSLYSF